MNRENLQANPATRNEPSPSASGPLNAQQAAGAGALLVGLGIALGAFGAHSLEGLVSAARLETFQTAVRYQIYSGLGLMLLGQFARLGRGAPRAALTVLAGTLVFCGSLYLLVAGAPGFFGAVAPVGGGLMIAGWLVAAWRLWRS
ncbi:MAG: DUF423 domain-containing protein [Trueperaceae bacterium]|jgi:uncharacterized membrane protein YgdD (TMEM256/DUF423 family)